MARALVATAAAHAFVALIAVVGGLGGAASGPLEIIGVNGLFVVLWGAAAFLFARAARQSPERPATAA